MLTLLPADQPAKLPTAPMKLPAADSSVRRHAPAEAEAAAAEMESELRDALHIVAPLRSKVDAMQQQIAKLKARER